jgi:hypothetical protein
MQVCQNTHPWKLMMAITSPRLAVANCRHGRTSVAVAEMNLQRKYMLADYFATNWLRT